MSASPTSQGELLIVDKRHSESIAVVEPSAPNPMAMLQMAVQQGADLAKLEKLMDLQERWEKNEARKAYVAAMAEFKKKAPALFKDKHVRYDTSKGVVEYDHATLGVAVEVLTTALAEFGFMHDWTPGQDGDKVEITCTITHVAGHSKATTLKAQADMSGSKNSIQGMSSTVTYLERYTLLAALGMAPKDKNVDNDGAGVSGGMDENAVEDYLTAIRDSSNDDELKRNFKEAYDKATAAKDKRAQTAFMQAKNARYKEMHK